MSVGKHHMVRVWLERHGRVRHDTQIMSVCTFELSSEDSLVCANTTLINSSRSSEIKMPLFFWSYYADERYP